MCIKGYKVKLLTDIILNQKSATEGSNSTLDFIPGNCFLGIVAGALYGKEGISTDELLSLFHNGDVKYGDAHVVHDGHRTLHVPACMFYPKLGSMERECYIMYKTSEDETNKEELRKKQLKQCRSGYFDFNVQPAFAPIVDTNFALKSAHDKERRTSKKSAMYGYQSLERGLEMYFEVDAASAELASMVKDALEGTKRVGRSRSSEYGLVEIKETTERYADVKTSHSEKAYIEVYADGRLIFLDENTGTATYQPTPHDLGIEGEDAKIDWKRSQIRTFSYAPWNSHRQCFDTDRCGIEKGSVIVVTGGSIEDKNRRYVGYYNNEGFGKIAYNPSFLDADEDGKAICTLQKEKKMRVEAVEIDADDDLLKCLQRRKTGDGNTVTLMELVNEFYDEYAKLFRDDKFASQWGTIRSLACLQSDTTTLHDRLFRDGSDERKSGYLMHGKATSRWDESGRKKALRKFIEEKLKDYSEEEKKKAVINLASLMAKYCRKEKK